MNRNFLLLLGAMCWTVAALDAGLHLIGGDVVVPAVMGIAFVSWVGLRGAMMARRPSEALAVAVEA